MWAIKMLWIQNPQHVQPWGRRATDSTRISNYFKLKLAEILKGRRKMIFFPLVFKDNWLLEQLKMIGQDIRDNLNIKRTICMIYCLIYELEKYPNIQKYKVTGQFYLGAFFSRKKKN